MGCGSSKPQGTESDPQKELAASNESSAGNASSTGTGTPGNGNGNGGQQDGVKRQQSERFSNPPPPDKTDFTVNVGSKVAFRGYLGVVSYMGETNFGPGTWLGLTLDKAAGPTDGSFRGERYFTCEPRHGVFCRPSDVSVPPDEQETRQALENLSPQALLAIVKLQAVARGLIAKKKALIRAKVVTMTEADDLSKGKPIFSPRELAKQVEEEDETEAGAKDTKTVDTVQKERDHSLNKAKQAGSRIPKGLEAPESVSNDKATLAQWLVEGEDNVELRARAIFLWVAFNIKYDMDRYFKMQNEEEIAPYDPFIERKGVCQDFSQIFMDLCTIVGIEARLITGYAKGYSYTVGDHFTKTNHAWNKVFFNGAWRLLDCTWAGGKVLSTLEREEDFDEFQWMADPRLFADSHFPLDPTDQFLQPPITQQEFEDMPMRWPDYHRLGIKEVSHKKGVIELGDGTMEMSFDYNSEKVKMSHALLRADHQSKKYGEKVPYSSRIRGSTLQFRVPNAGEYFLHIYGNWLGEKRHNCVEYKIVVEQGTGQKVCYPHEYEGKSKHGVECTSHNNGWIDLDKGEVSMSFGGPESVSLLTQVFAGTNAVLATMLPNGTSVHGTDVRVRVEHPGDYLLRIFAKNESQPKFDLAMDFQLDAETGAGKNACLPKFYDTYYDLGIRNPSCDNGLIELEKGRGEISFDIPEDVTLSAHVSEDGKKLTGGAQVTKGLVQVIVPYEGDFKLDIFGARGTEGQRDPVASYWLRAEEGAGRDSSFPSLWPHFHSVGLSIVSEPNGIIHSPVGAGEVVVGVPDGVELLANAEKVSTPGVALPGAVVVHKGTVRYLLPDAGSYKLTIFAKNQSDSGSFHAALGYVVKCEEGAGSDSAFPKYGEAFHTFEAKLISHKFRKIEAKDEIELKVSSPKSLTWLASLKKKGEEADIKHSSLIVQEGDEASVHVRFADKGEYSLLLFAADDGKTYQHVVSYDAISSTGGGQTFPTAWPKPGLRLVGPLQSTLAVDKAHTFELACADAVDARVTVVYRNKEDPEDKSDVAKFPLTKDGDRWKGEATFTKPGKVSLTYKLPDAKAYPVLAQFDVDFV